MADQGTHDSATATPGAPGTPGPPAVLELRVHGVHGTSPASMLGLSPGDVAQVAGDRLTGIYRARPGVALPRRTLPPGYAVEAYSWGALTSGVQGAFGWLKRVLWLLLLPFALVNLSYWARLGLGEATGTARWGARAVRVAGLLLTVFLVLTPCLLAIDMVAWQCYRGAGAGCLRLPGYLDFLVGLPAPRRMAIASAVPIALVLLLWVLSRASLIRFEDTPAPAGGMASHDVPILRRATMWIGKRRTERLQRLHLTVALATVVGFSSVNVIASHDGSVWAAPYGWVLVNAGVSAGLSAVAVAVACTVHPDDLEHRGERRAERFTDTWVPSWAGGFLLLAQAVVTVSHLLALAVPSYDEHFSQTGDFVGHNTWFVGVFIALTALHLSVFVGGRMPTPAALLVVVSVVVLAGLAVWQHAQATFSTTALWVGMGLVGTLWVTLTVWHYWFSAPRPAVAWRGAGASVMLATAAWVSLLFSSGLAIAGANYLNGGDSVSDLVSRLPADLPSEEASSRWSAPGEVTVRDAVVVVSDGVVSVTSGIVEVERLTKPLSGTPDQALLGGGVVREGDSAEVALDAGELDLEHVCLVEPTRPVSPDGYGQVLGDAGTTTVARCSAEDASFLTSATLAVDGPLHVDATRSRVLLRVAHPPQMPLVVPQVLIWTPIMQLAWVVVVGVAVVVCLVRFARRVRPALRRQRDPWVGPRDWDEVLSRRRAAALAHRAEVLLDVVGAATAPVALTLIVLSSSGRAPWQTESLRWTSPLATPAMYLVLAMSAGLVLLGSRLRTSDDARRAVGVIWDLTTFWPRAAHPLAPPCYAERVVPELRTRVAWGLRTSAPDGVVVVSGHSQGSLIVTAVLSRLGDADLGRLRVVTYGSQVRALYGRVFPRVVGPGAIGYAPSTRTTLGSAFPDVPAESAPPHPAPDGSLLARLRAAGGDWVNLFRRTDPLGFRVFGDVDGDQDRVTAEVPLGDAGDPGPLVAGHSGYQHSPEYVAVVDAWAHGLPAPAASTVVRPVPADTTDVAPLPEP